MDSLDAALGSLSEAIGDLTNEDMLEIGHVATNIIILRTKQGLDVDGKPFAPYSDEYAKLRAKRGLSEKPNLAVTGHMLGAIGPNVTAPDEVTISYQSEHEAVKASAHNSGVDKDVYVRPHSRSTYVNVKGKRASRDEIRKDKRRAKPKRRLFQRDEAVTTHQRHMKIPKREHADIRMEREFVAIEEAIGKRLIGRIEKVVL